MQTTKTKLKLVELTFFRGASNATPIEFDPEKKITMIFGENGTGKSSIVDAFSFLCERKLGSIEDRSGAERKYITSVRGKPEQLSVKLVTSKGTWKAAFKPKTATIEIQPQQGCPDVRILRRSNILRLVEAPPSERFEALQDYINVPAILSSEASLREAVRDTNDELNRQTQAFSDARATLTKLWEAEGRPGENAEKWTRSEAGKDLSELKSEYEQAEKLLLQFRDLENGKLAWERTRDSITIAESELNKALVVQTAEEEKLVGQSASLLALLTKANDYITGARTLDACPVCLKPNDATSLKTELQSRISQMTALSKAASTTAAQKKTLEFARGSLIKAEETYGSLLTETATQLKASNLPCVVATSFPEDFYILLTASIPEVERVKVAHNLLSVLSTLRTPLASHKNSAQKSINQQTQLATQLELLLNKDKDQMATGKLLGSLKKALELVEETRKAFVIGVLTEISEQVEDFYTRLHPKESVGGIRLSLDPKFIGSLHLHGDFYTVKDVTPQSLFSESHLDTLGLCVFLALAKKYKTEDTIVILDDVLTSVDREHLDRFIALFHDEEQHFNQIILTTHYQPWRDRYRNHRAPGGKLHFIELRPWRLDTGICVQGMKLCLDELRQAMTASPWDRQIVASKSGIFLENMLEFLARLYVCKVPFTSQTAYTLRELTDCFSTKLLKALEVDRLMIDKDADGNVISTTITSSVELNPIIAEIKQLGAVRNQVGCHYNFGASDVTDAEVQEFGKLTMKLGEALVCEEGGDFPSRNRSGSYHESRSGKVRLHPFREPS